MDDVEVEDRPCLGSVEEIADWLRTEREEGN
jgi:hypothetical protein